MNELRHAWRHLVRRPGGSLTLAITLSLASGPLLLTYSIIDDFFLKRIGFPESSRVYVLESLQRGTLSPVIPWPWWTALEGGALKGVTLAASEVAEQRSFVAGKTNGTLVTKRCSPNYFEVFGQRVAHGAGFRASALRAPGVRTALLSNEFWRRQFSGRPSVVGDDLVLDGFRVVIAGVLEEGYFDNAGVDLWTTFDLQERRQSNSVTVHAKLANGERPERATAAMESLVRHCPLCRDTSPQPSGLRLTQVAKRVVDPTIVRGLAFLMLALLASVLAVCWNASLLFIAQTDARQKELAILFALGASRARVFRQRVYEALIVSILAGAIGGAAAWAVLVMLSQWLPVTAWTKISMRFNLGLLVCFLATVLLTTIGAAALPALLASRVDIGRIISEAGGSRTLLGARLGLSNWVSVLIAGEVLASTALVCLAGLLGAEFAHRVSSSPGFNPDDLHIAQAVLPAGRYRTAGEVISYADSVREGLASMPGIDATTVTTILPIGGASAMVAVVCSGSPNRVQRVDLAAIDRGYLDALGTTTVRGRAALEADFNGISNHILINDRLARDCPAGNQGFGTIRQVGIEREWAIAGIIPDIKVMSLDEAAAPTIFVPFRLLPSELFKEGFGRRVTILVRSRLSPGLVSKLIDRVSHGVDPSLVFSRNQTMDSVILQSLAQKSAAAFVFFVLSTFALLTVCCGIFGLAENAVARRLHETGIRLALGAGHAETAWLLFRRNALSAAAGLVLGLALASVASRWMWDWFTINTADPRYYLPAILAVSLTVAFGSALPLRKIFNADPARILREL